MEPLGSLKQQGFSDSVIRNWFLALAKWQVPLLTNTPRDVGTPAANETWNPILREDQMFVLLDTLQWFTNSKSCHFGIVKTIYPIFPREAGKPQRTKHGAQYCKRIHCFFLDALQWSINLKSGYFGIVKPTTQLCPREAGKPTGN